MKNGWEIKNNETVDITTGGFNGLVKWSPDYLGHNCGSLPGGPLVAVTPVS